MTTTLPWETKHLTLNTYIFFLNASKCSDTEVIFIYFWHMYLFVSYKMAESVATILSQKRKSFLFFKFCSESNMVLNPDQV